MQRSVRAISSLFRAEFGIGAMDLGRCAIALQLRLVARQEIPVEIAEGAGAGTCLLLHVA